MFTELLTTTRRQV